ncbi:YqgQ family protein [Piscibacillus salipiscarius]
MADLNLMEDEIKALHDSQLINSKEYTQALLIIKNEKKELE